MKSFIIGALCSIFLVACGEEKTGGDMVPADHPHPDMVPAEHEHPEARAVEPNETTGVYGVEALPIKDTCNNTKLPTEPQNIGLWYISATQFEYLFHPVDGNRIFRSADNGATFTLYDDEIIDSQCAIQITEWWIYLNFTKYEMSGIIDLDYYSLCVDFSKGEEIEFNCELGWKITGKRI